VTAHKEISNYEKALKKNILTLEQITGVPGLTDLPKFLKENPQELKQDSLRENTIIISDGSTSFEIKESKPQKFEGHEG